VIAVAGLFLASVLWAAPGAAEKPAAEAEEGGADSGPEGVEPDADDAVPGGETDPPPIEGGEPEPSETEAETNSPQPATARGTPAPRRPGPPFYDEDDTRVLRERYGVSTATSKPRRTVWRCLIPDPACGFQVELVASSGYAYRFRQGAVNTDTVLAWHSGRAAYDVWIDIPAMREIVGKYKWTRLTIGPKVGVIASDNQDLWGNFGVATRYWFGRGKWAPSIEFTTALVFRLRGERGQEYGPQRSPVGFTGDIGVGIGGWGAIIVGGQYDSPLAREEVPEEFRISTSGQFFVGFRGNILWGAPAAAAVATHAATQRSVTPP
jgi:hypothetical protein